MQFPGARPVELTEIDALPGTEHQLALLDRDPLGSPHQGRFHMRRRISLQVPVPAFPGNDLIEHHQGIRPWDFPYK